MRNYPAEITAATLAKIAHISDADIEADIAETQQEIVVRLKLSHDAQGVAERQAFVAFLRRLLLARRVSPSATPETTP